MKTHSTFCRRTAAGFRRIGLLTLLGAVFTSVGRLSAVPVAGAFVEPLPGFITVDTRVDSSVGTPTSGTTYVLGRNAPGIFEIALWMRGFENYYCDMVANQPFAEALLDLIMEVKMKYWARALELLGPNVMMISEADDLASPD